MVKYLAVGNPCIPDYTNFCSAKAQHLAVCRKGGFCQGDSHLGPQSKHYCARSSQISKWNPREGPVVSLNGILVVPPNEASPPFYHSRPPGLAAFLSLDAHQVLVNRALRRRGHVGCLHGTLLWSSVSPHDIDRAAEKLGRLSSQKLLSFRSPFSPMAK